MDWPIIKTILLVTIGVYEVIARFIPSVADWTVLGNIFKFLKWISDYLNNLKKK